ncbi:hypothetical protein BLSMQ_2863 [Brevibacterium aurantiacum]|uniref:Uncharacterized protein n=1 Tax=Brevibacterium aurantiacum TaxID=273384 RepID=A0A1D7W695_BREAU|nr:hypothetical protein BLSMQ_2863 [Brevibacterium aurantiacum]
MPDQFEQLLLVWVQESQSVLEHLGYDIKLVGRFMGRVGSPDLLRVTSLP